MGKKKEDREREDRIEMDIVVDAYDSQERALGWYSYLENTLVFPFAAQCTRQRLISPLKKGDKVEVIALAPPLECQHEIFIVIRWDRKEGLGVPLSQLRVHGDATPDTRQAVEDWLYWMKQGYEF